MHLFINENGSGGSRRVFNALTDLGRILFVRAAKWAMGEELEPYKAFKILDITPAGTQAMKLSWEGSPLHNYKIQASDDLATWSTVIEDVAGVDGVATRTLDSECRAFDAVPARRRHAVARSLGFSLDSPSWRT